MNLEVGLHDPFHEVLGDTSNVLYRRNIIISGNSLRLREKAAWMRAVRASDY